MITEEKFLDKAYELILADDNIYLNGDGELFLKLIEEMTKYCGVDFNQKYIDCGLENGWIYIWVNSFEGSANFGEKCPDFSKKFVKEHYKLLQAMVEL